jgi:hypothetical protein
MLKKQFALILCAIFLQLLIVSVGYARVFDIGKESFASYLKTTYVSAGGLNQKPFEDSSGTQTTSFSEKYGYATSYEFGFTWASPIVSTRIGIEVIKPSKITFEGKDSANNRFFYGGSDISGYAPKIGFEFGYKFKKSPNTKVFLLVEGGSANITIANTYDMTGAGTTQYPTVSNFREEVKGTATTYAGALGIETRMFDTTTLVFEAGYRGMNFTNLNHNLAVTNFQGTVAKGDSATNNTGEGRSLNLSGPYVSLMLRFWVF